MLIVFVLISCLNSVLVQGVPSSDAGPSVNIPFGGTDFKQYYTSSQMLLENHNPYDYERGGVIQRAMGHTGVPQIPYGPPTTLLPFIPMGWVDFLTAIQIQFVLNVAMLVISCFLWGKMLFPDHGLMPLFCCVAVVAWIPCLTHLGMGHVTTWTLLGFTLWCFLMREGKPWLAGCCLALSIIKPHLALGLVAYAGVYGLRHRDWRMLTGFALTVLMMIAISVVIRPTIWSEYLASIPQSNPTQWYNATVDGWGRYTFGQWFHCVAVLLAIALFAWIVVLAWDRDGKSNLAIHGPLVFALWMVATTYAFSYDFILMLPCLLLAIRAWFYRTHSYWLVVIAGWVMLDLVYIVKKGVWSEYQYFFIPLGGLALTLLLHAPQGDKSREKQNVNII